MKAGIVDGIEDKVTQDVGKYLRGTCRCLGRFSPVTSSLRQLGGYWSLDLEGDCWKARSRTDYRGSASATNLVFKPSSEAQGA
jgi:hypothetical protein